jgi:thiol-disulfide isomerase/thioredoxin
MRLKKYWPWLLAVVIIGTVFGLKTRTSDTMLPASNPTQVTGPAVILFRGDNSPSCQVIHRLVDEAEQRYSSQITFRQLDWSPDNPLIEHYQVRFLPTVLLIDRKGKEVARIIGESPAVQARLKDTLARLDPLLMQ